MTREAGLGEEDMHGFLNEEILEELEDEITIMQEKLEGRKGDNIRGLTQVWDNKL